MLIWRSGGRQGKDQGFDGGSRTLVGTFDYCQVPGVVTFEFHPITDAILDWKL